MGMDIPQSGTRNGDSATSVTVTSAYRTEVPDAGLEGREVTMDNDRGSSQTTTPFPDSSTRVVDVKLQPVRLAKQQMQFPSSTSNSQDTSTTTATIDPVFTPPASEGGQSQTNSQGNAQESSQESQLLQLSQLAAAQERMPDTGKPHGGDYDGNNGQSRKRMADGMVKGSASPKRVPGHSRNTSTISVASTTGSRIGEVRSGSSTPSTDHQLLTRCSLAVG
jgi:hypothetical protein